MFCKSLLKVTGLLETKFAIFSLMKNEKEVASNWAKLHTDILETTFLKNLMTSKIMTCILYSVKLYTPHCKKEIYEEWILFFNFHSAYLAPKCKYWTYRIVLEVFILHIWQTKLKAKNSLNITIWPFQCLEFFYKLI